MPNELSSSICVTILNPKIKSNVFLPINPISNDWKLAFNSSKENITFQFTQKLELNLVFFFNLLRRLYAILCSCNNSAFWHALLLISSTWKTKGGRMSYLALKVRTSSNRKYCIKMIFSFVEVDTITTLRSMPPTLPSHQRGKPRRISRYYDYQYYRFSRSQCWWLNLLEAPICLRHLKDLKLHRVAE